MTASKSSRFSRCDVPHADFLLVAEFWNLAADYQQSSVSRQDRIERLNRSGILQIGYDAFQRFAIRCKANKAAFDRSRVKRKRNRPRASLAIETNDLFASVSDCVRRLAGNIARTRQFILPLTPRRIVNRYSSPPNNEELPIV